MKHVVACLAESTTSLAELTARESENTRLQLASEFDRLEQNHVADRLHKELMDSLFYPDVLARQEQVDYLFDGLEDSYQWIFDKPYSSEDGRPLDDIDWHSFPDWLVSGRGLYWMNGKAGSGKSTLINYVCQHENTLELLDRWCDGRVLLTPAYFFWSGGTCLQKSIDGCLRSILWQIIRSRRDLVGCLRVGCISKFCGFIG